MITAVLLGAGVPAMLCLILVATSWLERLIAPTVLQVAGPLTTEIGEVATSRSDRIESARSVSHPSNRKE